MMYPTKMWTKLGRLVIGNGVKRIQNSSRQFILTPAITHRSVGSPSSSFSSSTLGVRLFSTSTPLRMATQCRQNYHEECEANVNKQINLELHTSYVYMSIAYYFDRDDVAFQGLFNYFKKGSDEEREHAEKFMKYQNQRGGRVILESIQKPSKDDWTSPMNALTIALEIEKNVNQSLLDLHKCASTQGDPHLCDYLESHFLEEQVKTIKELSDYITRLKRCGNGLGEHIFDKDFN